MRLKPYEAAPDTRFGTAILEHADGREERIAWLWLPIWGYEYDFISNAHRWGHRVLVYRGWYGFQLHWRFPVNGSAEHHE